MSRRRADFPSIRYSLSPERNRRRVMVNSRRFSPVETTASTDGSATSPDEGSNNVSVTLAMPMGLRSRVPAKMTSSMRAPRKLLADCSPSTQFMASLRFDFPHPLGPTTAAMPEPLNRISVLSAKDLKPCSSTRFSFSNGLTPTENSLHRDSRIAALGGDTSRVQG